MRYIKGNGNNIGTRRWFVRDNITWWNRTGSSAFKQAPSHNASASKWTRLQVCLINLIFEKKIRCIYRTGLIRMGDRLLKVDNHILTNKTLLEAQKILKETSNQTISVLTIEYDVNIMESVKYATGPLLVEIDNRQMNEDLGLLLTNCCEYGGDEIMAAGVYVENIVPASTADRCGALNIGDQLLGIDEFRLEDWSGSIADAERLLRGATKLQILPYHAQRPSSRSYPQGKLMK